jgi:hypothetical protein
MDADRIERRLRLHMANMCMAVIGGEKGDLRLCKEALLREVERIASDAENDGREMARAQQSKAETT